MVSNDVKLADTSPHGHKSCYNCSENCLGANSLFRRLYISVRRVLVIWVAEVNSWHKIHELKLYLVNDFKRIGKCKHVWTFNTSLESHVIDIIAAEITRENVCLRSLQRLPFEILLCKRARKFKRYICLFSPPCGGELTLTNMFIHRYCFAVWYDKGKAILEKESKVPFKIIYAILSAHFSKYKALLFFLPIANFVAST